MFAVDSDASISAIVAATASTDKISVTTAAGTATSDGTFVELPDAEQGRLRASDGGVVQLQIDVNSLDR